MAVVAAAALVSVLFTSTVAWAASAQGHFWFKLGNDATESTATGHTFGKTNNVTPKFYRFIDAGITNAGTAEDPYVVDFSDDGPFSLLKTIDLNPGWTAGLFGSHAFGKMGYVEDSVFSIDALEGNTDHTYLVVKNVTIHIINTTVSTGFLTPPKVANQITDGQGLLNSEDNLLAVGDTCHLILENDFSIDNTTPDGFVNAAGEARQVRCGAILVRDTGELTVRGVEPDGKSSIKIVGRVTNKGTLNLEGSGNAHNGAVLSSGVDNDYVSLVNYGTLTMSGGTIKNKVIVEDGTMNVTAGTINGDIEVKGGTLTISDDAVITGNITTSGTGKTVISGGTIEGSVTATGGTTEITGGTFKKLPDPKFLKDVDHFTVAGTSVSDRTYTYSKGALDEKAGYSVPFDLSSAQNGVVILSSNFKPRWEDASSVSSEEFGSLLPGEAKQGLPNDDNSMWAFFYASPGTYSASCEKGGALIWSSNQSVVFDAPSIGLFQFSFEDSSLKDKLDVDTYTLQVKEEKDPQASSKLPISSVSYNLDGGTLEEEPGITYYLAGDTVTPVSGKPVKSGATFSGGWMLDGSRDLTVPAEPKACVLKPIWTEHVPSIELTATERLEHVEAESEIELQVTITNPTQDSHTGVVTVEVALGEDLSLRDDSSAVKVDGSMPSKVEKQSNSFTVEYNDLSADESFTITYHVVVAKDAKTGPRTVSISAQPSTGESRQASTSIDVVALPRLSMELANDVVEYADAGTTAHITATLSNVADGSKAAGAEVAFKIPADFTIEGGTNAVSISQGNAPVQASTTAQEDGFSIDFEKVAVGEPFTVEFDVRSAEKIKSGDYTFTATASPKEGGFEDSGETTFHVMATPIVKISGFASSVKTGQKVTMTTALTNTATDSATGPMTVTFKLPEGAALAGDVESSVTVTGYECELESIPEGFQVKVDTFKSGTSLTVKYQVAADKDAENGQRYVSITAKPTKGEEASFDHSLTISRIPWISLDTQPASVQLGMSKTLYFTISNDIQDTQTGITTVTFTLPDSIKLVGGAEGVSASCAGSACNATVVDKVITIKPSQLVKGSPLSVSFKVEPTEAAQPCSTEIKVTAKPTTGNGLSEENGTIPLTIIAKPTLSIGFEPKESLSVTQGSSASFTATIANDVADSTTGSTTVTFSVPEDSGLTLKATSNTAGCSDAEGTSVTATATNIANGEPLAVKLDVKASNEAKAPVEQAITVTAKPTYGAQESWQATKAIGVEEHLELSAAAGEKASIQQGTVEQLSATVTNTVAKSNPGKTKVTFTLPEGIELEGEDTTGVTPSAGTVERTDTGFTVSVDTIADTPLVVHYNVRAKKDTQVQDTAISIKAEGAEKQVEASATQELSITPMPSLSIGTAAAAVQQGSTSTFTTEVKNTVAGSATGELSVTFTLPEGISLAESPEASVKTSGVEGASVSGNEKSYTVTLSDLTGASALSITSTIKANDAAKARADSIDIAVTTQDPVAGTTNTTTALTINEMPKLTISCEGEAASIQKGHEGLELKDRESLELKATVENLVPSSSTGSTTVTFTLPDGIKLTGDTASEEVVYARYDGGRVKVLGTTNGFSLTLDKDLEAGKPLTVTYHVLATSEASSGENTITVAASPKKGTGATETTSLEVIDAPSLTISAANDAESLFQQGLEHHVQVTVANTVEKSVTGIVTTTVTLPQGFTFKTNEEGAAEVTLQGADDAVATSDQDNKTLTITSSNIPEDSPLVADFDVCVAKNMTPGDCEIKVSSSSSLVQQDKAIPVHVVKSPAIAVTCADATVQQGNTATLTASITNAVEQSRTGKVTITVSLPQGVNLAGNVAQVVVAHIDETPIEASAITAAPGGFSIELDELSYGENVTVSFGVKANDDAALGSNVIQVLATSDFGEDGVGRAALDITSNGHLSISASGATVEQGHVERLTARITNPTLRSVVGSTTVNFILPNGVALDGDVKDAVSAAFGSRTLTAKATQKGFSITAPSMSYGDTLDVSYTVSAAEDAEPGAKAIIIIAVPSDAGMVSTSTQALLTIEKHEEAPSAGEIVDSTTDISSEISDSVEEATGGRVSVEVPKTELGADEKSATVSMTVLIAEESPSEDPENPDAEPVKPLDAEEVGQAVVSSVFASAKDVVARAKTSLAQSYDDPSIKLNDLGSATDSQIADFARRCIEAILPKGEAQALASGTSADALFGRTMKILVVTDQGTRDQTEITYTFTFEGRSESEPSESAADEVSIYRLYNKWSHEHLYTTSKSEYETCGSSGWTKEGASYMLPAKSDTPVYRLFNRYTNEHFYTTSTSERDSLVQGGLTYEGIAFYSAEGENTIPIYRLYNHFNKVGSHLWTVSQDEYQELPTLVKNGWKQEGVVWRALKLV